MPMSCGGLRIIDLLGLALISALAGSDAGIVASVADVEFGAPSASPPRDLRLRRDAIFSSMSKQQTATEAAA